MATGKRYYWIKLKDNFFADDGPVDFMMSQPNGSEYVVLYQMLCLKTINTGGRLSNQIGEVIIPYDVEKIRRTCKYFSGNTIRVALSLYKSLGLVYEDVDGTLVISEYSDVVGSETDWASKKKRQRLESSSGASLPSGNSAGDTDGDICVDTDNDNGGDAGGDNVPIDIRDKEIRDKESKRIDIRDTENRAKNKKKADAFVEFAGGDAELLNALKEFEQMRVKMKKPMTDRAKSMLVKKLSTQFSHDIWIEVLKQSIYKCWLDVYPLNDDHRQGCSGNSQMDELRQLHEMFSEEE